MLQFTQHEVQKRPATAQQQQHSSMVLPDTAAVMQRKELSAAIQRRKEAMLDRFIPGGIPSQVPTIQRKSASLLPLPVQNKMEATMGADFSNVNIHPNSQQAQEVGALAYTQGNDVHFAPGQFDPNSQKGQSLIGHELAHVVQQRQGRVQATTQAKGLPVNDDPALEKEADVIGEKAAQMKEEGEGNAENPTILDEEEKGSAQMKVAQLKKETTHYGDFEDTYFEEMKKNGTVIGADLLLKFTPKDPVDASKIAMVQSVKNQVDGKLLAIDLTSDQQQVKKGSGAGYGIDRLSDYRNPLYATGKDPADVAKKDKMEMYSTPYPAVELTKPQKDAKTAAGFTGQKYDGWGGHGKRVKNGANWDVVDATLHDSPTLPTNKADSEKMFETAALAVEGPQKGTYYGSVSWGMRTDGAGVLSKVEMKKESDAVPTQKFMAAAKLWNASKARGSLKANADDVIVYDGTLKELFKLKKGDVMAQESTAMASNIVYLFVKVDAAHKTLAGKQGYIKMSDVEDAKDGKETLDLPYIDVQLVTAPITDTGVVPIGGVAITIPIDTRVEIIKAPTDAADGQIKVVHGPSVGKILTIKKASLASLKPENT